MHPFRKAVESGDRAAMAALLVMVRPLSAATALAEAMGAQFERIQREAAAELGH